MTKNQLKLQIWNLFNGSKFSEKVLQSVQKELNDEELGAFVDLFSDTGLCAAFINTYNTSEELESVFSELDDYKNMAKRYLEALASSHLSKMRQRVFCNHLDDFIETLNDGYEREAQLDLFNETAFRLLEYMKALKVKIDVSQTDISQEENALLEALECDYEGLLSTIAFEVFLMYMDVVTNVEKLEAIFRVQKPIIEFYIKEMKDAMDVVDCLCFIMAKRNDSDEEV